MARGNDVYQSLSPREKMRYGACVQAFFDHVESYRSPVTEHRLERNLEQLISMTLRRLEINGFRQWRAENTVDYADDFVNWVEIISPESPD